EFDDVVQKDLQVVKKLWADMANAKQGQQEEPLTRAVKTDNPTRFGPARSGFIGLAKKPG
ncbi:hypothetical protein A2U01_0100739, partial [Trifolium medium]|nr:hypothetical protein [Trifolium medium]